MKNFDPVVLSKKFRGEGPTTIIEWAMNHSRKPLMTTNFGPFSASMIHAVAQVNKNIEVVWCDTGYNTSETYRFASDIISRFNLDIHIYTPKQTTAFRNFTLGGIPDVNHPDHQLFTEQVKLEPFRRALKKHQPDVWFTNLRKGQTAFRDGLDIFTTSKDGILKVCPFFYWSEEEVQSYLNEHNLANELNYFDPTKVLGNRECGLHYS